MGANINLVHWQQSHSYDQVCHERFGYLCDLLSVDLFRIPDAPRFELRLADGAANPYLLPAVIIAAGLDGATSNISPPPRQDTNQFTTPPEPGTEQLPLNLLDALRAFEADEGLQQLLGASFSKAFVALKKADWQNYASALSAWEVQNTLDC